MNNDEERYVGNILMSVYVSGGGGNGDGDNRRLGGLKVEFREKGGMLRCLLAFVPIAGPT